MAQILTFTRDSIRLSIAVVAAALLLLALPLAGQASALTCGGKRVTIMGTPGNDVIIGRGANDVIYGGGGDDKISGGRNGNDWICGGPGNDVIHGGRGYDHVYGEEGNDVLTGDRGSDMLDGGGGNDKLISGRGSDNLFGGAGDDTMISAKGGDQLNGGPGNDFADSGQGSDKIIGGEGDDKLLGDKGNDTIDGGPGNDVIEGGLGDDPSLEGGPGTDVVLAGPGTDRADGGDGDGDIVRGDAGTDTLSGGSGDDDIVSYSSATREGVEVNLAKDVAEGDGHDVLSGFEDVVGSPQPDEITGDGSANRIDGGVGNDTLVSGGGGGEAFGGPGSDKCSGFRVENSCGPETGPAPGSAYAILNQGLDGSSLVVQGGEGLDDLHISQAPGGWTVSNLGVPLFAGEGCSNPDPDSVFCSGAVTLINVSGGGGNDDILIDPNVPASVNVKMTGNAGNDTLIGGEGPDVIEAGEPTNGPESGNDRLIGNGGSDTLYADPGADQLYGGKGSDLLVNSVVSCQGNLYDGGAGEDTVNYDRSHGPGIRAELDGTGGPIGCSNPDHLVSDESLEGSEGDDILIGNAKNNGFLGHEGADVFIGKGGVDYIDAADGQRDKKIDCGAGNDEVVRDKFDPRGISC
jgi:Ca2+-binding RTX toxin-like protein